MAQEWFNTLKQVENSIKKGWDGKAWQPHASVEGGNPTIAYGHKLTPEEIKTGTIKVFNTDVPYTDGLNEVLAGIVLKHDINTAFLKAHEVMNAQSDPRYATVLGLLAFNTGEAPTSDKWPKLHAAMAGGNDSEVAKEMVTVVRNPDGSVMKRLTGRANELARSLGISSGTELAGM